MLLTQDLATLNLSDIGVLYAYCAVLLMSQYLFQLFREAFLN